MAARIVLFALLLILPGIVRAAPPTVTVEKLCSELPNVQHEGDADYMPGKDVYWRDVVPADLQETAQVGIADDISVAISSFQAQQMGFPASGNYSPETFLGWATIKKDGSVYFNNKRLTQPQIQFLCDPAKNPAARKRPITH